MGRSRWRELRSVRVMCCSPTGTIYVPAAFARWPTPAPMYWCEWAGAIRRCSAVQDDDLTRSSMPVGSGSARSELGRCGCWCREATRSRVASSYQAPGSGGGKGRTSSRQNRRQEEQGDRPSHAPSRALCDDLYNLARDDAGSPRGSRATGIGGRSSSPSSGSSSCSNSVVYRTSSLLPHGLGFSPSWWWPYCSKPSIAMPAPFPPGATACPSRHRIRPEPGHGLWRWSAVLIHALRQALCPSPGLLALLDATRRGDLLRVLDDGPRRRLPQSSCLRHLLRAWVLG